MPDGFPRSARGTRQLRVIREYHRDYHRHLHRLQRRTSIVPTGCMITSHLIDKWLDRVAPDVTRQEAGAQILQFLAGAFLINESAGGNFYLGHPSWPECVIVLRKTDLGWVAKTTLPRWNAELVG